MPPSRLSSGPEHRYTASLPTSSSSPPASQVPNHLPQHPRAGGVCTRYLPLVALFCVLVVLNGWVATSSLRNTGQGTIEGAHHLSRVQITSQVEGERDPPTWSNSRRKGAVDKQKEPYISGTMGTTSSVALRTAREFADYKLDFVVDMTNVVVLDGAFHFYNLPSEQEAVIRDIDLHNCCLQINCPQVHDYPLTKVFHQEPLNVQEMCSKPHASQFMDMTSYFLAAYHLDNIWHLLLDNIVALVSNILTTPNCQEQLPCSTNAHLSGPQMVYVLFGCGGNRRKSILFRFPDRNPKGPPLPWDDLFIRMFSQGNLPHKNILEGGPYCLSQVVWGLGIKPIYQDYVDLKQWSFTALRDWLIEEYNVTTARSSNALVWDEEVDAMGGLDPGYLQRRRQAGVPLKALYFHRDPKPGTNRHIEDYSPIVKSFEKQGVQVEVMKDFSGTIGDQLAKYIDSDIVVGLHGAGLTNAMFSRKGMVLVEYKSAYGSAEAYRKIAQGRYGGYMQVPLQTPADDGYHIIPPDLSDKVAACTVGMFDSNLTACRDYHGYLYAFERGHKQDCLWDGDGCLPLIIGLHYIKPLQPGQQPVPWGTIPLP